MSRKTEMEMSEVNNYIRSHVSDEFTVDVAEQNPIQLGEKHLYLVRLERNETGEVTTAHAVVPTDRQNDDLKFVRVHFSPNPFATAMTIEDLVA